MRTRALLALTLALPGFDLAAADPLAHTFSIVARDPATGEMGVAVQSHWYSVGSLVPWAEAGVGAVATQSFVEPAYGPRGLALMKQGMSAPDALAKLLAEDEQRDVRQVAMVDAKGRVAAHTGKKCIAGAGDTTAAAVSCQANLMRNEKVWGAMIRGYQAAKGDLADRLLAALEAGQAVGGDIRGQQSAAILIVKAEASDKPWTDKVLELRVEDHPHPIEELKRLVRLHRAYEQADLGDRELAAHHDEAAKAAYARASDLAPGNMELLFWKAAGLFKAGDEREALPIFEKVFRAEPDWALLVPRLADLDVLSDGRASFQPAMHKVLSVAPPKAREAALAEWKHRSAR